MTAMTLTPAVTSTVLPVNQFRPGAKIAYSNDAAKGSSHPAE